jgi:hypothetical protein
VYHILCLHLIDTRVAVVGIGGRLCTEGSESSGGVRGEVVAEEKCLKVLKRSVERHCKGCCSCVFVALV